MALLGPSTSRPARTARALNPLALTLLWLASGGCATGGDDAGGLDNLPSAGIVPVIAVEEPILLGTEGTRLTRPWGISDGGDTIRLWVGVEEGEAASYIGMALATRLDEIQISAHWLNQFRKEATAEWEGAGLTEPSVVRHAGLPVMAYVTSEGSLGVSRTSDPTGESGWDTADGPALVGAEDAPLSSPSLVSVDGELLLFVVRDGRLDVAGSADGVAFAWLQSDVLAGVDADGEPLGAITSASVVATRTPTGRVQFRAHFQDAVGIGFAGAFADRVFSRWVQNPIFKDSGFAPTFPMQVQGLLLHSR
ncbi:MAG: hypothetical protein ACI9WU_000848, partial [Myxococcota bacterium]